MTAHPLDLSAFSHAVGNDLGVIIGHAQLLAMDQDDEEIRDSGEEIRQAAQRIQALLRELINREA